MYRPSRVNFMSDTLLMISLKNDLAPYQGTSHMLVCACSSTALSWTIQWLLLLCVFGV
jgi:hypothetical protein